MNSIYGNMAGAVAKRVKIEFEEGKVCEDQEGNSCCAHDEAGFMDHANTGASHDHNGSQQPVKAPRRHT